MNILKDYLLLLEVHDRNMNRLKSQIVDLNNALSFAKEIDDSKDEVVSETVFDKANGGEQGFAVLGPLTSISVKVDSVEVTGVKTDLRTGRVTLPAPLNTGQHVTATYTKLGRKTALTEDLGRMAVTPDALLNKINTFWSKVRDQEEIWLKEIAILPTPTQPIQLAK